MKRSSLIRILIGCIAVLFLSSALADEQAQDPAQQCIEKAVVSYAACGERDEEALSALSSVDPALGKKWTHIMVFPKKDWTFSFSSNPT